LENTAPEFADSPTSDVNSQTFDIIDDKSVKMMLVPEGEFTMGSDADDALTDCLKENDQFSCIHLEGDEYPPHQVYLDAFYMDKYEVTNILYKSCVNTGICTEPGDSTFYDDASYENHPVSHVDWFQAMAYCEWRGATLPTEAQWEKAARGTEGRTYPWGEGISCDKANYGAFSGPCVGLTTKVGSYDNGASPYGIYDMAGNVQEWVADWYSNRAYHNNNPILYNPVGPANPGSYSSRVVRGGDWGTRDIHLRSADRESVNQTRFQNNIGFRCALNIPVENSP